MAGTITLRLNVLKSSDSEAERNRAVGELFELTFHLLLQKVPRFVAPDDAQSIVVDSLLEVRDSAANLHQLANRDQFWALLHTCIRNRAFNLRRARAAQKRGGRAHFETGDAVERQPAAPLDRIDLTLEELEFTAVFEQFLTFLERVGEDEQLAEMARRRFLLGEEGEQVQLEMGLTPSRYRLKVTRLNAEVRRFIEELSGG